MNTHRIKQANLSKVSAALQQRGINFSVVSAPLSDAAYYSTDGWYGDDHDRDVIAKDLNGMIGISCNLSGKKFHRLLVDIGVVDK